MKYSSECVLPGHPDKVADLISDSVVDFYLEHFDKLGKSLRVAVETIIKDDNIFIAGEVYPFLNFDEMKQYIIKNVKKYAHLDVSQYRISFSLSQQSSEIAGHVGSDIVKSGDQSIVYGYSTSHTTRGLPKTYSLACDLAHWAFRSFLDLGPDGKIHVDSHDTLSGLVIDKVTASFQVKREMSQQTRNLITNAIKEISLAKSVTLNTFKNAGSFADAGVTGRKLMVDTYGGLVRHGGGAFSGKDPTKVDRTGAYYARHIAEELISKGLLSEALVCISFDIGRNYPNFIQVTSTEDSELQIIEANKYLASKSVTFDEMTHILNMWEPKYCCLTNFGHFKDDSYKS